MEHKTTRIVMRLANSIYDEIRIAARLSGVPVGEFVSAASLMSAQAVMKTAKVIDDAKQS